MVFLSRFKSHRPENLTASLPQQPTFVLAPGVRPARSHRGHARGGHLLVKAQIMQFCIQEKPKKYFEAGAGE
jgi:hypothetical protein